MSDRTGAGTCGDGSSSGRGRPGRTLGRRRPDLVRAPRRRRDIRTVDGWVLPGLVDRACHSGSDCTVPSRRRRREAGADRTQAGNPAPPRRGFALRPPLDDDRETSRRSSARAATSRAPAATSATSPTRSSRRISSRTSPRRPARVERLVKLVGAHVMRRRTAATMEPLLAVGMRRSDVDESPMATPLVPVESACCRRRTPSRAVEAGIDRSTQVRTAPVGDTQCRRLDRHEKWRRPTDLRPRPGLPRQQASHGRHACNAVRSMGAHQLDQPSPRRASWATTRTRSPARSRGRVADVAGGCARSGGRAMIFGEVFAVVGPAGVGGRPASGGEGAGLAVGSAPASRRRRRGRDVQSEPDMAVRVDETGQDPAVDGADVTGAERGARTRSGADDQSSSRTSSGRRDPSLTCSTCDRSWTAP